MLAVALVILLGVSACGSDVVRGHPGPPKSVVPADHYDAAIFLCPGAPLTPPCTEHATAAEAQSLRAALLHDAGVRDTLFVSERNALHLAKLTMPPKVAANSHLGDFPASYDVDLAPGQDVSQIETRYGTMPGVLTVVRCVEQTVCQVSALRRAGVIH